MRLLFADRSRVVLFNVRLTKPRSACLHNTKRGLKHCFPSQLGPSYRYYAFNLPQRRHISPLSALNKSFDCMTISGLVSCSILGGTIFWLASMRPDNRYLAGVANVYQVNDSLSKTHSLPEVDKNVYANFQQKLGYGFFVHCLGSLFLFASSVCSCGSAYMLIRREWRTQGCCIKTVPKSTSSRESYTHYPSLSFYNQRDSDVRLTSHLPSCSEYSPNASIVTRMERHRPSYDPCAFPEEGV